MKELSSILIILTILFSSCKKEEPTPEPTPTPTPTVTTVNKSFAINASSPAFTTTYGVLAVYLDGNQINQVGNANNNIGTPASTGGNGPVYYDFEIDILYHMELSVGSGFQYKADVKFDSAGTLTQQNIDPANTVTINTSYTYLGAPILLFQ